MSEHTEVTKVVENVDRLFSEIVVNGESHVSDRYVPPEPVNTPVLSTNQSSSSEEEQTAEQNDEPVQGEYVKAVELNNILHDFNDEELAEQVNEVKTDVINLNGCVSCICSDINDINSQLGGVRYDICCLNGDIGRIDTCIGVVQEDVGRLNNRVGNAEGSITCLQTDVGNVEGDVCCLQTDVGDLQSELVALNTLLGTVQSRINEINTLIPNQASCSNQLADKAFVNSSIATNTANFLGTYTSMAQIEAIPNPTNNDYAFLQTTDSAGNTLYKRYKYSADTTQWLYEYDLNNSSFTAEQWATINSGLTQSSVCSDISSAIGALDVASAGGSGKFISEIQQNDGKICATESCIASCVASGDNSPVSSDAVFNAIGALCAQSSGGSGKYISAIQQTDGKVLATEGTFSNTVQSGDYAPVTSDAVAQAIAGAGVSAVDAVVSGCMSPITSNAVANWSPNNFTVGNAMHIGANGAIYADGSCANYPMIKFKSGTDVNGNGVVIGGGGAVVIGGGESADTYYSGASLSAGSETMAITNDGNIVFASNLQSGYACRKVMILDTSGSLYLENVFTTAYQNASSWWINKNPRGKFVGTDGGLAGGWSPLLAGKTVNGKYEFGSLNNTIYLNYYCDSRTTNGIDKTIFDYTQGGTPNWNGNATTASCLKDHNGCATIFCWNGNNANPSWVWGSNAEGTTCVYNPRCFTVKCADSADNAICLQYKRVLNSNIGGCTIPTGTHWAWISCACYTANQGYIALANGFKATWGKVNLRCCTADTTLTLTLFTNVAFTSIPTVTVTINTSGFSDNSTHLMQAHNISKTGFQIKRPNTSDTWELNYIAIGY